jgi:predicted nucleic acid-binding protein
MIVLDTNVLSEIMKPQPATKVLDWMAAQAAADLYTTSITQAEILLGLMLLPPSRRRSALDAAATSMFEDDFGGRILGFGRLRRLRRDRRGSVGLRPVTAEPRASVLVPVLVLVLLLDCPPTALKFLTQQLRRH